LGTRRLSYRMQCSKLERRIVKLDLGTFSQIRGLWAARQGRSDIPLAFVS